MKHKLVLAAGTAGQDHACSSADCGRAIGTGAVMWIDRLAPNQYCDGCGKSLQYRRDKAVARGEDPPVTFEDAEARFQLAMQRG